MKGENRIFALIELSVQARNIKIKVWMFDVKNEAFFNFSGKCCFKFNYLNATDWCGGDFKKDCIYGSFSYYTILLKGRLNIELENVK